jgi:2-polyprenyl-6-hydroxyphenyl methylase/3-demethylubiquinone-9 3-methyltransferase
VTAIRADAPRFAFGRNWSRFVRTSFTQERVDIARRHLLEFLGRTDLEGVDMLDIGCGSGLHSLAACQARARRIKSFDYDPDSVATTESLRRHAGEPPCWSVSQGDVLDRAGMERLGKWGLVYSWGVLHHTGSVWQAIENAQACVAEGGLLYIALYSADVQSKDEQAFWLATKQEYNRRGRVGRQRMAAWYIWTYMMGRKWRRLPLVAKRMITHRLTRGMSMMTDIHDWLGGWPMEYTHDQDVVDMLEGRHGFRLVNIKSGEACTEFLFRRSGTPEVRTNARELEATLRAEKSR